MQHPIPSISYLKRPEFLIQAWKKTASYIRYHNWYADSLELDLASVDLPNFINQLSDRIPTWRNEPLKIVPAPKSQCWHINEHNKWVPRSNISTKLRPLAHVCIEDQVLATAIMLCLADQMEQLQGSPIVSLDKSEERKQTISYGNRLYCSTGDNGELLHHWGSTKLYRSYYQDYNKFIERSDVVASEHQGDRRIYIVQSDLSKFYDRVSPELLHNKIIGLLGAEADPQFIALIRRVFNWEWNKEKSNIQCVEDYIKCSELEGFINIALPQGLVASGFLSNVILKDFDEFLRASFNTLIKPDIKVLDVCRYVDDLRIVLSVEETPSLDSIKADIVSWLEDGLNIHASGLKVSSDKTKVIDVFGDKRPLVRQSKRMQQIQHGISGGFDSKGGLEVLSAIQGLLRSQSRFSDGRLDNQSFQFAPVPDVHDDTVARFSAHRYRSTYRSLRLLLFDKVEQCGFCEEQLNDQDSVVRFTRQELDEEAKIFALGLIENWIEDPSNVRLLRVGLDICPDVAILNTVLHLLRQYTLKGGGRKSKRRVAWYCLSEIFRAGASETGFIENQESFPENIDISKYREALKTEGIRILNLPTQSIPWYLKQQILLFLLAFSPNDVPISREGKTKETKHYKRMVLLLQGNSIGKSDRDFAMYAILARRSHLNEGDARELITPLLTTNRFEHILERDPSFALELLSQPGANLTLNKRSSDLLRNDKVSVTPGYANLMNFVSDNSESIKCINELSILKFSILFLNLYMSFETNRKYVISPGAVNIAFNNDNTEYFEKIDVDLNLTHDINSMYTPPLWCTVEDSWRFNLAYLIRFLLTRQYDYSRSVKRLSWKENLPIYRIPESHWYQRDHGLYSGFSAFGADWLPISDWTEKLLFSLLQWPGCNESSFDVWINKGISETLHQIDLRFKNLKDKLGHQSSVLMMPVSAPPFRSLQDGTRPLRACIVQKVIPNSDCFNNIDLTFSDSMVRRCHRNHLVASLAAVKKLLDLRETHRSRSSRLDLLIFPELSIHPQDIFQSLVPFARDRKTVILAGMNYTETEPNQPLVNSALWIIPTQTPQGGLQVVIRRQGKGNLSPHEIIRFNRTQTHIRPFRPCQWIVHYLWKEGEEPLKLTASICYDATDIRLAADLREESDVYIIPSFNQDVKTYDQMALALHYHMYQMVIVANNGSYGGSSAYAPFREDYNKEIFHLHGQPQASVAFLEIDDIGDFLNRWNAPPPVISPHRMSWKTPPAR
ncbi:MAG: reverse transcriptase domain-containing protein [Candidatus Cloacimonadaceae bacterium]|nr:reverse transcriptase domain-containing protein [Candidatus Cloacimonadaceae bacterium]